MLSINLRGCQAQGAYARLIQEASRWYRERQVSIFLCQEHNLQPNRVGDLTRLAHARGFTLTIGFALPGPDNSHRGGTMILTADRDVKTCEVMHTAAGWTHIKVEWGGMKFEVGAAYAPSDTGWAWP